MQTESLLALGAAQQFILFFGFAAIAVGMMSSGWALAISLSAYAGCAKEHRGTAFIPAVMPGSQGLYSFAISFLMVQNMASMPLQTAFAGVICGFPCLYSAIGQAKTAAACIKAISNGQMDQGQALLATGVPELYALTGLAGAFLVMA
jgi:F0F1-type ATP synthase membrane subunit c/vacuolar-type H+-ATPase subunit K